MLDFGLKWIVRGGEGRGKEKKTDSLPTSQMEKAYETRKTSWLWPFTAFLDKNLMTNNQSNWYLFQKWKPMVKIVEREMHLPPVYGNFANYRSYSVIRRTVFFKKFLISTKNYHQNYFPETIFFDHSYWYDFKQIKWHTHIDFYEYGGSEKTSEVKFA